jgi:hypothetical protein
MIANVPDLLHRQCGLIVTNRKNAVWIRRVRAGNYGDDAIQCLGSRSVNMLDSSMWIRRMENLADQRSGKAEIVRVLASTGGFAGGIHHGDRFPDYRKIH